MRRGESSSVFTSLTLSYCRPVNFHPDKYLESLLDGSCHNKSAVMDHVGLCLQSRGGLVVDNTGAVIARGEAAPSSHPLRHTAMRLIDEVASLQGGGAFTDAKLDPTSQGMEQTILRCDGRQEPVFRGWRLPVYRL